MSSSNLNAEPQFLLDILPKVGVNLIGHYLHNRIKFDDWNPEIEFFGDGESRCRIFPLRGESNLNVVYSEQNHQDRTVKFKIESLQNMTILNLIHPNCVTYRYQIHRMRGKEREAISDSSQCLKFKYDNGHRLFTPL